MNTPRKFLNGDVHWLENVNKIIPRKMELPLLMQSKIQIKKNLYGIKSRLLKHMQSYDYKFRSLASEPKQVIRALRPRSFSHPLSSSTAKPSHRVSKIDRSLLEKSSEWKLPPNVYRRLGETSLERPQAGKLGPYQCFTVERDDSTIKNHYAPKSAAECCKVDFYELPSLNDSNTNGNLHKNKFLTAQRFPQMRSDETPSPTKYFPRNFSISPANATKSKIIEADPVFYYPQTTVPEREMTFNKEPFSRPEPGRYNPHDVTCRCHLKATTAAKGGKRRCAGKIDGEGHTHVFDSTVPRLVHDRGSNSSTSGRRRRRSHFMRSKDDMSLHATKKLSNRHEREPISFRVRSSIDVREEDVSREVSYNTMVRKRSLFSLKTGRPVAFLSASPRFEETEKPIKLYEKAKRVPSLVFSTWSAAEEAENIKKSNAKRMTKQRLEELAMPRNALPKRRAEKIQVYTKLPPPTTAAAAAISIQDENSANMLDVDNLRCGFSHVDVVKLRVVNGEHDEETPANVIREE